MSTHLYRAVNAEPIGVLNTDTDDAEIAQPGEVIFGRTSGYLSRSGAASAGNASGHPFEIIRSEPVVFLTRRQKLEREIDRLRAELDATS